MQHPMVCSMWQILSAGDHCEMRLPYLTKEAGFGVALAVVGALPSSSLLQKSISRTMGQTATLALTFIPVLNIESDEGGLKWHSPLIGGDLEINRKYLQSTQVKSAIVGSFAIINPQALVYVVCNGFEV